jgi:ubiquinone/menaquinone biosynthesis C-methylase UbiE
MPNATHYVPALRFEALTRFYDPVVALTTRERSFKQRLLAQAALEPKHEVLDLGCGTGTLAIWAAQAEPSARVTALDGDPTVLKRAREKAERADVSIQFDQGLSYELPYASQSFDRVLSSLFFHHLLPADKERTLAEVFRVLRAGGELHIADWGRPTSSLMRLLFFSIQLLDGFPNTQQHVAGELSLLFQSSGFDQVAVRAEFATVYGTLALYSARKPA